MSGMWRLTEPPHACQIVPNCPVCFGELHIAHSHSRIKICVCRDCGTTLSIPDDAWLHARMNMEMKKNAL
jgi:hypothetical protein